MSFVAILVALLLEQARPLARANPIHMVLRQWVRWSGSNFDAGRLQHGRLAWGIAVIAPTVGATVVYWLLLEAAGWPVAVAWNTAVLYVTLGFRQFSHHFTEIRDALEAGDEERAHALLADWRQVEVAGLPRGEMVRQVIEYSVIAAHRHVFGVLAWFSVLAAMGLGPAGAVFYRLAEFVPRYWLKKGEALLHPVSGALQGVATRAWTAIDWLPARVTSVGFAMVGSFEEAIESWRAYEQQGRRDNDGVILAATSGAIGLRLNRQSPSGSARLSAEAVDSVPGSARQAAGDNGQEPQVGHLRTVVGLVWRTIVMWMILLALLTLARLLG